MEKIKISEELCDYIECLHYEINAIQDLLVRMKGNSDEELNEFWINKYIEKYKEYNIAKQQLENDYIIPNFGRDCTWHLDFESQEVEVNLI